MNIGDEEAKFIDHLAKIASAFSRLDRGEP